MQNAIWYDPVIFNAKMKNKPYKKPEFWVSAIGLAVLITVFLIWYGDGSRVSIPGLLSALLSATLFAIVCLRFVPRWMSFWRKAPMKCSAELETITQSEAQHRYTGLKIFVSLLLVNAFVVLMVYWLRHAIGYNESFLESLDFWTCTDSGHYLDIARDWYLSEGEWDRLVQLVFLPGYPLAIRLVNILVNDYLYSGMLVSSLSFAGAGCVIYRLLRLDYSHRDAIRAVKYFCLLPGGFFFVAPMSESLFLLMCAACIYFARTKKWLLGCVFGALASFTRSLGLTLFVPLFFELISSFVRKREGIEAKVHIKRFAALFIIPAGFAAYCFINYRVSGNPFKFMEYQRIHWGQQMGWFFNTAAYQLERAISCYGVKNHHLLGLWLPNLLASFASLAIMILAVKKMRPSYTAWYIAYFVIAIGATWLLSAPRYLIALIPVPLAVSQLTKKPMADMIISATSLFVYLLYLYAFVMRWQVW